MKQKLTLIIILFFISTILAYSQENSHKTSQEITTYYLIRHAEKDRSTKNENPILSEKGNKRAENWTRVFSKIKLDAVFSTDYIRTKETVNDIAKTHNLELQIYDPNSLNIENFKQENMGKTVLIAGHSNTNPQFVNKLIGENKFEDMADDDNGSMYVVTICGTSKKVDILKID